jgi:hypothetical protein
MACGTALLVDFLLQSVLAFSPPVVFNASGGYARTALLRNGTTLLSTSKGGFPTATCGIFSSIDSRSWYETPGPKFDVLPGSDLSNCAPGEAPNGALVLGVRHHDKSSAIFRIQSVRSTDQGRSWDVPSTIYATRLREHAAWEPVFFQSLDGQTLRVAYSWSDLQIGDLQPASQAYSFLVQICRAPLWRLLQQSRAKGNVSVTQDAALGAGGSQHVG